MPQAGEGFLRTNQALAVEHFEDALVFCRKAGYRPELAWTCCDYADTLLMRRGPGDAQKAKALLDESRDIAVELGMRPLAERASEKLAAAESTPDAAPAYPDGLSHREVEVLLLVAQGRTNQEIADTLFITARTVANHISNILNKTSAANRTEAASYANRHGLA